MDLTDEEHEKLQKLFKERRLQLTKEREEKILQYESFINEKLKVDLQKVLTLRDQVYQEIADYLEVRNGILLLKESEASKQEALIPLGSEFFVQAKIPDASHILLQVGLGFVVEYTHDEALKVIALKEEALNLQAEKYTQESSDIKARIKLMLHGLSELYNLPPLPTDK